VSKAYRISNDIQLPLPTAIWVLSAHVFAILVPLALIAAVSRNWDVVMQLTAYPSLLLVAAGVMMAGSAFEVAQNAHDHWYLTPDTGSAEGTGFCDFLFFWCIVASQGLIAVACIGDRWWVVVLSIAFFLAFPFFYIRQFAQFVPLAVLGVLATVAAYLSFDDPVIFLQLLLSPLTMYFFNYLLKTGNQVLHGFTTLFASAGVLFLAWGINSAAGQAVPLSWLAVGLVIIGVSIVALLMRPLLARLPATERPEML